MSNVLGLEPLSNRQSWEKSLGEFLEIVVNANPDKVFVEIAGQQITYADFYSRCRAAAAMFRSLGIKRGDRVCMFLPNVPEVLYTWFGLALIGGITVTINTAYRRDEMAFILNNAEASALVAHDSLIDVATQAADIAACVRHRLIVGDNPPVAGWRSYSQLLADSPELAELPEVSPTDISMLQYTSGTTGNPKGVQVTHTRCTYRPARDSPCGRGPRPMTAFLRACPTSTPTPSITARWAPWLPAQPWWCRSGSALPVSGSRCATPGRPWLISSA